MTIEELRKKIAEGESETLEWKETTGQRGDACQTLCAFLNKDGGTVIFGVTKKGRLTGQLISDKTKRELFEVFQKFEPAADIETEWIDIDDTHQAIVCTVERGNCRPYVYDGRPYKRVQSSTTVMKREEYNRMLEERRGFESLWEALPNPKLKLEDIDLEEVKRTAKRAVRMGRLDASVDTEDALGLLDHFKLRENGVLLNGAAVLFGNNRSIWYPQLEIKMGWFRGTTDREFLDNRHVSGSIFKLMDEAMAFCFKHLNVSAKISGKLEREEELEVPSAALREALVNAFAHRDYDDTRTIYLAVYSDRVEIKSPGAFPSTLPLDRLYDPPVQDSIPRNPRIAHVLYLCKMIETWGRGIGVIAGECERVGLPLPVTERCGGSVVTVFKRPKIGDEVENPDQDLDHADPDLIQIDPDSDPDSDPDFTDRLLQTLRRNPLISRKLLSVELNTSERKIRESLKKLKDSGIIVRHGPDHGGIWRISRIIKKVDGYREGNREGNDTQGVTQGVLQGGTQGIFGTQGVLQDVPQGVPQDVLQCVPQGGKKSDAKNKLSKMDVELVDYIKRHPNATAEELAKLFACTSKTIRRHLAKLPNVNYVGHGYSGHWEVTK